MTISSRKLKDETKAQKVKIRPVIIKDTLEYQVSEFVGRKVLHTNYTQKDVKKRIEKYMEEEFKQAQITRTDSLATILSSKSGTCTCKYKKAKEIKAQKELSHNRTKKYIIQEGTPVGFMIDLGVMTPDGRIVRTRYDKFRQINRFLEFIEDILPRLDTESFNLQYGTNYIAVMPTNLYGPNDNFHLENSHVLPAMIRKIHLGKCLNEGDWDAVRKDMNLRPVEGVSGLNTDEEILAVLKKYGISGQEVTLWGTGKPLREFLWSEEMADASVYIMEHVDFKDTYTPGSKDIRNCHINIGTGKEITIAQLADKIVKEVGYQGKLTFDATKPDGTMRKLTDVSKLHSLGWQHKIDIEEGVHRMYQWYLS